MDRNTARTVTQTLGQLYEHGSELAKTLENDRALFSSQDFAEIKNSNQKKLNILTQFHTSLSELNQICEYDGQVNLFDHILKLSQSYEPSAQQQVSYQVEKLNTVLNTIYQNMLTNNKIVFANLETIYELFSKIAVLTNQDTQLYDKAGQLSDKKGV